MTLKRQIIDEAYPTKVSAIYENQQAAETTAENLVNEAGFVPDQIEVVHPDDSELSQKLEPERGGIKRTLLKSHLILGGGFFILGILIAAYLSAYGPPLMSSSPLMTFIAFGIMGLFAGLLLAGLISIRPDHDVLINKTRGAAKEGKWVVIVHCKNEEEKEKAKTFVNTSAETL
ncbi:hypothetical protein [Lacimicrobium alkaliphilum]|uniref:Riboflavin biosynthesis protein RibA n=1 Tax=Lacimicrobium alkaliphilum TaxID=1526571 RepID=A0A0U2QNF5_9ALTE|nr:hypothetical protein [Lacimicrobium alkaliphilum]ALS99115.1 hypothetical protein AT746_13135 [Lacimicrobium alkaliphilum]